jgi:CRP/FNR family transcriptional regulator, cyclic AMP receptor protein
MNHTKHLQKGEVIFHEGNLSDYAYIIETGSVEILEQTSRGQKLLGVLGENEIFGEMGLIDGLPRSATARAKQDTLIHVLTPKIFEKLVRGKPEALLPILRILTNRLREILESTKLENNVPFTDRHSAVQKFQVRANKPEQ